MIAASSSLSLAESGRGGRGLCGREEGTTHDDYVDHKSSQPT